MTDRAALDRLHDFTQDVAKESIQFHLKHLEQLFLLTIYRENMRAAWGDETHYPFSALMKMTDLDRETVRALCRCLTDKGKMQFSSTLTNDDGEPCGSGYGLTSVGVKEIKAYLDMIPDEVAEKEFTRIMEGKEI